MAHVAGQQSNYLSVALKRYRDGSTVRKDPTMRIIVLPDSAIAVYQQGIAADSSFYQIHARLGTYACRL